MRRRGPGERSGAAVALRLLTLLPLGIPRAALAAEPADPVVCVDVSSNRCTCTTTGDAGGAACTPTQCGSCSGTGCTCTCFDSAGDQSCLPLACGGALCDTTNGGCSTAGGTTQPGAAVLLGILLVARILGRARRAAHRPGRRTP